MTLREMAAEYRANGALLRERRSLLKAALKECTDPEEQQVLQRRIRDLTLLYRESREMALIMERYYSRST